jgi:tetratricopeptide (TPR) repeat protein
MCRSEHLCLWLVRRKIGWGPLLALGYFVLMLLPVLGLINIYFMRYSLVADHWQYAASLGPIALFAVIVSKAKVQVQCLIGALVLLPLIVLCDRQSTLYHTGESLWRDTMAKSPDSWMVYTNLGRVLDSQGRAAEAVPYHDAALRLAPELPDTHENVALGRILQGRYDDAETEFHRALAIDPHFVPALTDLAKLELFDRRNPAEAEHYFQLALHDSPMFGPANYGYGVLLEQQGKLDDAANHYRLATEDSPDDFDAAYDLGSVLLKLNRPSEAIDPLRTAVRLQPSSQRAWTNLRAAYATSGQLDAATEAAREEMRVLSKSNP